MKINNIFDKANQKIKKIDTKLIQYKEQIKNTRPDFAQEVIKK